MIWHQTYLLFGRGLGFSVLLAALPIVTLLVLLGVFRRPAWLAGLCGLGVTFLLATLAYKMPAPTAISAAGLGVAFGLLPITWLIFWAIALFRITVETGQFEIIKNSIGRLTPDPRLQALLIAFAFGAFLEGAAGFGTPVAIAASMLIGLGFSPFSASAICLLANTAPVAFGSIGIPIVTLAGITGLPLNKLSGDIGAICTPIALIIPAYLILAVGGFSATEGIWLPLIAAGSVFAAVQLFVSMYIGPQLTDILAAIAAIAALILVLRIRRAPAANTTHAATMLKRFAHMGAMPGDAIQEELSIEERAIPSYTFSKVLYAWMPYAFLVACVIFWGSKTLQHFLDPTTIALHWPMLHDVVYRVPPIVTAPAPYHAIYTLNLLATAGTACMFATILSALWLRASPALLLKVLKAVIRQLAIPTATVSAVLAIAFLMNYCGATATLGLAFAASGRLFPFFSALLGWMGVFLTGSDTSANALFGNLQVVTAQHLGFSPILMAAANSSGGVMGKMISLQTIAIAAAATGLNSAEQVKLFRFTLKHSILLAVAIGCITMCYAYVLHLS
jgi:L-lactate transport